MKKLLLTIALVLFALTFYAQPIEKSDSREYSVIYLGHSGWAIKMNNNFLIFDYQERYDFEWEKQPEKNILSGYIDTEEIKDYNVYVFTSHEHSDHFDPLILDWDKEIENITYFFGWDFSSEDKYNCLKEPRAHYEDEAIEVFTVNSRHSRVFESAFLVKIDGITIYHNGDYKGDYKSDYKYFESKTDKIDIAFSNSDPWEGSQYILQCALLDEMFSVDHFFPMHSINEEKGYKEFAEMVKDEGVRSTVHCAEVKGDKFIIEKN
ncbi:MAG: MBL fold metallo-hydrolase [Bacteroidales bacterium]|nr:MBL fold metallo-hydrolase [Bacteroidales bacterium]